MKKTRLSQVGFGISIFILLCSLPMLTKLGMSTSTGYLLPPPLDVEMVFEESLMRRMCIREFTDEPVTDEELSTVLWAACGFVDEEKQTVAGINGVHAGVIYVLKEDAAYVYNPENHSLVFFREGDWRDIVGWQYEAPLQLGLCWDTNKADPNFGGAELGQIGQNIMLMANALNLGTVVCGQIPPAIDPLDIPENEEGMIVMPLGHLRHPYTFKYRPWWLSFLPKPTESEMTLSTVLEERSEATTFSGTLTRKEVSQLLWSSYGFSLLLDQSEQETIQLARHRTVPSAHGYYPFHIYGVTERGIYRYVPNVLVRLNRVPVDYIGIPILTFKVKVRGGDHREDLAQASSMPSIASAPLSIISVLDVEMTRPKGGDDLSGEEARRFWYYEAGSSAHTVMLQATTLGCSSDIVSPTDTEALSTLLRLKEEQVPLFIAPIGA
jgi:hypothetical protein